MQLTRELWRPKVPLWQAFLLRSLPARGHKPHVCAKLQQVLAHLLTPSEVRSM